VSLDVIENRAGNEPVHRAPGEERVAHLGRAEARQRQLPWDVEAGPPDDDKRDRPLQLLAGVPARDLVNQIGADHQREAVFGELLLQAAHGAQRPALDAEVTLDGAHPDAGPESGGSGLAHGEPVRKRLTVGSRLTAIAFATLRASMRDSSRHALLRRLAHQVNETCNIGVILNGEIVYLDRVEAEHWPLRLHFTAGSRVPLHCSAIGKLHLALLPARQRQHLLQSLDLRRFTNSTITERPRLEAELRQIRKERVSFDREEYLAGVVCVAAPVIGRSGEMLAAIAIQAPEARMNVQIARGHLPALRRATEELTETFQDNA